MKENFLHKEEKITLIKFQNKIYKGDIKKKILKFKMTDNQIVKKSPKKKHYLMN
jgi:hypothetical protein